MRALRARGVELDTLEDEIKEALDLCNVEIADALHRIGGQREARDVGEAETLVAESRARLRATRSGILASLPKARRTEVLEAMLSVVVDDGDLEVESVEPVTEEELAAARARAEQRHERRKREEARRRRAELVEVDVEGEAAALFSKLPEPWLRAIALSADLAPVVAANEFPFAIGSTSPLPPALVQPVTPTALEVAKRLRDHATLAATVACLRPVERRAVLRLLESGGVAQAAPIEKLFGDCREDGYSWDTDAPTSVLGRLRARGLCVVGRVAAAGGGRVAAAGAGRGTGAAGESARNRRRVIVIPRDLRWPLAEALAKVPAVKPPEATVAQDVIDRVLEDEENATAADIEMRAVEFDRAQPELAELACVLADTAEGENAPGAILEWVERIWVFYDTAHPGRLPRARRPLLDAALHASERELQAVERMHEKMLQRRVGTLVARQPALYAFVAQALEDPELPLSEADRALVFHACDTTIRAFDLCLS